MGAQSGEKYELDYWGEIMALTCEVDLVPFLRLIEHNLAVFEQRLFSAIADTPASTVTRLNVQHIAPFPSFR